MEKIEQLRSELESMYKGHRAAWEHYGSELCAGEMLKKERKLLDQIRELENEN